MERRIIAPPMADSFWERRAFSIVGRDFAWIDVVFAAMARGEWSAFERRLAEGLACAARADVDAASPPDEAIDEAATAYRYDRDLISAADVTAWLDRVGLSADEWIEYLRRDLLRQQWSGELDDLLDRFAPSARDLVATAVVDGICSGAFDAFERAFAGRAALVFEADAARFDQLCGNGDRPTIDPRATQLAHTHAHWLSVATACDPVARLSLVTGIERASDAIADAIASNGRLKEIVDDNRLAWMRLEIDTLSFASEAAAREALLCVRADGLSFHDVASLSRSAVQRAVVTLDDLEPSRQEALLAAEPGSAVGPLSVDGGFDVALLVNRAAPALSDPAIAARAKAVAVNRAEEQAARDHVRR
jgi:hypothetical protein